VVHGSIAVVSVASCHRAVPSLRNQERGEGDHPQQLQPVRRRRHRRRHDLAGADAARGDEQPWSDSVTTPVRDAAASCA
jgi:hypothetical protein